MRSTAAVFVIDDETTWLARRPQDLEPAVLAEVIDLARDGRFLDAWRRMRVKLADGRVAPPKEPPYNLNPNQWSFYAEGTTYFLPVTSFTYSFINALLELFRADDRGGDALSLDLGNLVECLFGVGSPPPIPRSTRSWVPGRPRRRGLLRRPLPPRKPERHPPAATTAAGIRTGPSPTVVRCRARRPSSSRPPRASTRRRSPPPSETRLRLARRRRARERHRPRGSASRGW